MPIEPLYIGLPCALKERVDTSRIYPEGSPGGVRIICDGSERPTFFVDYDDPDQRSRYWADLEEVAERNPKLDGVKEYRRYCDDEYVLAGYGNPQAPLADYDILGLVLDCG